MGLSTDKFINAVPDYFICPVCLDVLDDPVSLCEEDHLFCRQCVTSGTKSCPSCREPINQQLKPYKQVNRAINSLIIKCEHNGCDWQGEVSNELQHKLSCIYLSTQPISPPQTESCPNRTKGCPESGSPSHIRLHIQSCPKRLISCERGGHRCRMYHAWKQREHDAVCAYWVCPNRACSSTSTLANLRLHRTQCDKITAKLFPPIATPPSPAGESIDSNHTTLMVTDNCHQSVKKTLLVQLVKPNGSPVGILGSRSSYSFPSPSLTSSQTASMPSNRTGAGERNKEKTGSSKSRGRSSSFFSFLGLQSSLPDSRLDQSQIRELNERENR